MWHFCTIKAALLCSSLLLILLTEQRGGTGNLKRGDWIRNRYWQCLLLVFELNMRLLFWIKYDLGVLSLLFHRQLSRSGANSPCQHAFGFLLLSHRLDFSLGELFWEMAMQRTNSRPLLLLTYWNHVATATVCTNRTFRFESFIVTKEKKIEVSSTFGGSSAAQLLKVKNNTTSHNHHLQEEGDSLWLLRGHYQGRSVVLLIWLRSFSIRCLFEVRFDSLLHCHKS